MPGVLQQQHADTLPIRASWPFCQGSSYLAPPVVALVGVPVLGALSMQARNRYAYMVPTIRRASLAVPIGALTSDLVGGR